MFTYNKDLTPLTTFGVPAKARIFAEYSDVRQLTKISRTPEFLENEVFHIGGGSNLLFLNDFNGLVLHSAIKGIERYDKNENEVFVIAGAGEKWTDLVDWTVAQGLGGLENLAAIPGEVGASAVQNVGAYGAEAGDFIHAVECFDTETRKVIRLEKTQCRFGYRDSFFKHEGKGRLFILRVSFRLIPSVQARRLDYGPLKSLAERLGHNPTIEEVKSEIEKIRSEKLPDVKKIGSAGSFFKNPVVSEFFFREEVLRRDPEVSHFRLSDGREKISAAWLIDHSGLKGECVGGACVYEKQPLVIVNSGNATASDICRLAEKVTETVHRKFGIRLQREVNYIDSSIDVTVLGSGTSKGVPEIGCSCDVCSSSDSHDKRLRSSVLVSTHGMKILIDASPDFRAQALTHSIRELDAVLVTHYHADHVGGFDDLRAFCGTKDLPVYLRKDVDSSLRKRLDYCFREHPYPGVPHFQMNVIENQPFFIDGLKIIPIEVMHGKLPIFGYRIGDFAYITDAKTISENEKEKLKGLKVLVINALRDRDHFAHFTISEALELIEELKPEKAFLTHLCHEAGRHESLSERLPENVSPAYDGMHIHID